MKFFVFAIVSISFLFSTLYGQKTGLEKEEYKVIEEVPKFDYTI